MHAVNYWCELAWLPPGEVVAGVLVKVEGSMIAEVVPGVADPPAGAVRLAGLTLPGLANAHSHAFHRVLRGATQREKGTFWTWREQMYGVAGTLDPDSYLRLARAVYAEMALAGITCVGEFHYLHHAPGGTPYDDPNAMGHALIQAAREAGLRIALLDACYLTGGIHTPLSGVQLRFGDGDSERWAARVAGLFSHYRSERDVEIGVAVHSVRAVPAEQMPVVGEFSRHHAVPLHAHVSEQRAENTAAVEMYAASPVQVLAEHEVLGPRATAVHATHVSDVDIALLGASRTHVCMCPTTERDLADGIGPARALFDAGSPITLGSDSHAVIDMFEEARAVELDERLATEQRGHFSAAELLHAATVAGHDSLGFPGAGMLVPGAWADLVSVRLDSARTAGASPGHAVESVVFAATAADVHSVVSGGRRVVTEGRHILGDVGAMLAETIAEARGEKRHEER
ncbi:formiminoglutamate deiminase [Streptosporangium becharense]|uniref:Formiminoglutamate deiminase n=1 Tax=Streptosporangium becharense TaxID=1816182 RepID=A0A7W9IE51_9ACTN|nr:formimidoylglutamate deiminase [Streptosporangium becharense]MBB2910023.1 formiminoglutamate deiminase [Streptosporangium becharense]MBB5819022.1 formiminoglutamate deiminase [Streptosporangium becharense]